MSLRRLRRTYLVGRETTFDRSSWSCRRRALRLCKSWQITPTLTFGTWTTSVRLTRRMKMTTMVLLRSPVTMKVLRRKSNQIRTSLPKARVFRRRTRRRKKRKTSSACWSRETRPWLAETSNANSSSSGIRRTWGKRYSCSTSWLNLQRTSRSGGNKTCRTSILRWAHGIALATGRVTNCWIATECVLIDFSLLITASLFDRTSTIHSVSKSSSTMRMRTTNRVDTKRFWSLRRTSYPKAFFST